MTEKMTGVIVGAAPIKEEKHMLSKILNRQIDGAGENIYAIAADGGIKFFYEEDICPDEWIGDMDSAGTDTVAKVHEKFPNILVNSCSPIKDDTDMAIAAEILRKKGIRTMHIFGGLGGRRIEHSIANIQLMHHLLTEGVKATMYAENSRMYCLQDEEVTFDEDEKGYISLFSLTDGAEIEIEGLFYEYSGMLTNRYALGVSNEFCGKKSKIKVTKGTILVVQSQ